MTAEPAQSPLQHMRGAESQLLPRTGARRLVCAVYRSWRWQVTLRTQSRRRQTPPGAQGLLHLHSFGGTDEGLYFLAHTPAQHDIACEKGTTGMENGVQHANAKLILPDGTEVELPLLQVSGMQSLHK